uniref:Semaphorin-1A n=1 Tax=Bactrocera dorsalis TaxID=27457 RepID=A0A034WGU7_BACDO
MVRHVGWKRIISIRMLQPGNMRHAHQVKSIPRMRMSANRKAIVTIWICWIHDAKARIRRSSILWVIRISKVHKFQQIINAQYTVETLVMAVLAGSIFSLLVGFFTGYFCGRRCHKDEDDNLPYPDTEYEYFEQRQNVNRIQAEPKLLPQVEEVTYAEPVLLPQPPPQNKMQHSPKSTLRKPMHHHGPNSETLFQFQPDGYNTQQTYRGRDNFGTLRSHQVMGDNYRRGDGFSTTRSVKKVYL